MTKELDTLARDPLRPGPREAPPRFHLFGEDIAVADQALHHLVRDPITEVFQRGRALSRVVSDGVRVSKVSHSPGTPVIERMTQVTLRDHLARLGEWTKGKKPAVPPTWLVDSILQRAEWPGMPKLEHVVEAPTMRPDGSILDVPGYDPASQILYWVARGKSSPYPKIAVNPTRDEAVDAAATLIEPLQDFPFVADDDKSAAVSAILSLVARPAIDGPVPLYVVRSPSPGTGKSLLADVVSIIGTGRPAPRTCMDHDTTEFKKQVLAIAIEGVAFTLLDNLTGRIGSPVFAEAVTSSIWSGRILGESRNVTIPLRTIWFATGNNVSFKADLGRRVTVIDLNAQMEHPEDRTSDQFKNGAGQEFLSYVTQARPRLVAAALTILRAYHVADRPTHGKSAKGSFEGWDSLVRGALVWVGLGDPDAGKTRVREDDDDDIRILGATLEEVNRVTQEHPFTIAELMIKAEHDEDLRNTLVELTGRDKLDAHRLGLAIRNRKERPVGGLMFVKSSDRAGKSKVARWIVKKLWGYTDGGEWGQ